MLILSLDGGGIRGVLTAELLRRLEEATPFLERVELLAGTSVGGILALCLAAGVRPAELVDLFVAHGDEIFGPRDLLDRVAGPADEVVRADYDHGQLKAFLEEKLGAATLGDLSPRVLVATFDLADPRVGTWKPKFLHNYETPGNDRAVAAVDAALRTSAAPTYFPSYQGCVDGGLVANNPATCAVAKAIKAGASLDDLWLLSVGTGFNPHQIAGDRHDWGPAQWLAQRRIIKVVMDGMPGVADYQCRQLLGDRYHRLDVSLPQVIDIDDIARRAELVTAAQDAALEETLAWLGRVA